MTCEHRKMHRYKLVQKSLQLTFYITLIYLSALQNNSNAQRPRNKSRTGRIPCSKFAFEGYLCINRNKCGNDGYTVDDAVDTSQIRTNVKGLRHTFNLDFVSAQYSCTSRSDICCRKSSYYGIPEPVIRDVIEIQHFCDQYKSFGYHCIEEFECGDDGYTIEDSITGGLGVRGSNSFASKLTCDLVSAVGQVHSSSMACCRNSTYFGIEEPTEFDYHSDECNKWKSDGFKCVNAVDCEDGYFDNVGAVPAIRGDDEEYLDLNEPLSSKCAKPGMVCCRNDRFYNKPLNEKEDVETEGQDDPTTVVNTSPSSECGMRNDLKSLATHLDSEIQSTWPHMCTIWKATTSTVRNRPVIHNQYVCGASLVSKDVVLTTAHNIEDIPIETLLVRCGEGDTIIEGKYQDRRAATDIINPQIHPNYRLAQNRIPEYDIALVKVDKEFDLNPNVNTICLPSGPNDWSTMINPQDCYATGFGQDEYDSTLKKKRVLKKIEMDVIDQRSCQKKLRIAKRPGSNLAILGSSFKLHDSFICAGGGRNRDTCTGDGGSPLVCATKDAKGEKERYVQVGIVSWGIGCGHGNPGVYANVIAGLEFINETLSDDIR